MREPNWKLWLEIKWYKYFYYNTYLILAQSTIHLKVFTSCLKLIWNMLKCMFDVKMFRRHCAQNMFFLIRHQFCYYTEVCLLSVSFKRMIDCVYMSFSLSLHYPNINPVPGRKCGIRTKAVSTWIAHRSSTLYDFLSQNRMTESHTYTEIIVLSLCLCIRARQWLPFCQSMPYLQACCVHVTFWAPSV